MPTYAYTIALSWIRSLLIALALLFPSATWALEKPREIAPFVHSALPYGSARIDFAFFSLYDATLWSDARPFSMEQPFALQLTYHHSVDSLRWVNRTLEHMKRIDNVPDVTLQDYGEQLSRLVPNLKDGDSVTAVYVPDDKTRFYINGILRGAVDDPDFGKPFFDIWLSEKTSEPSARKALLDNPPALPAVVPPSPAVHPQPPVVAPPAAKQPRYPLETMHTLE